MFSNDNLRQLRKTLDGFPIPMFAVQRATTSDAFRILCINRAHEDESGLANVDVEGLRTLDLLRPDEAEAVDSRYAFCAKTREVIQYDETLHIKEVQTRWRTILHPVRIRSGGQRVIGTSFPLGPQSVEPMGVARLGDIMAEEAADFGPVTQVLGTEPPIPQRRIIQAQAVLRTPEARAMTQSASSAAANHADPRKETV